MEPNHAVENEKHCSSESSRKNSRENWIFKGWDQSNSKICITFQKTVISGRYSFHFKFSGGRDILTDFERAQSICFISRYESLPKFKKLKIAKINGKYVFENLWEARSVLNEYRPIIQNKKDSVYYCNVHKVCREKLLNTDSLKDLSITVNHLQDGDITIKFSRFLNEQCKAIKTILARCEFDYIYNGILQHSDQKFTNRFKEEYSSGEINYVFIKHALIVDKIKILLEDHYGLLKHLTSPSLGPL